MVVFPADPGGSGAGDGLKAHQNGGKKRIQEKDQKRNQEWSDKHIGGHLLRVQNLPVEENIQGNQQDSGHGGPDTVAGQTQPNALKEGVLLTFLQLFKEKRTQIPALIIGSNRSARLFRSGKTTRYNAYNTIRMRPTRSNRQRFAYACDAAALDSENFVVCSLHSSALLSRTAASAARATGFQRGQGLQ